jgi:hypothetical protein
MNEALNEAVYGPFRFIEWDITLASIHSLFKGLIQPSNASYSSPINDNACANLNKQRVHSLIAACAGTLNGWSAFSDS